MLEVDVAKRLGESDIACRFDGGDGITVLFGPSGAGKTSVLNMIAGLLRPDYGYVRIDGQTLFEDNAANDHIWDYVDLSPEQRRAGYVFQETRLFPHMTVRANLLYGAADHAAFSEIARMLDVERLLDRWPRSLSGGEARRVAIGRALLSNPRFLLLDEPLSSLDRARREEVMVAIETLRDTARLPIVMVTHDQAEADRLATRIVKI